MRCAAAALRGSRRGQGCPQPRPVLSRQRSPGAADWARRSVTCFPAASQSSPAAEPVAAAASQRCEMAASGGRRLLWHGRCWSSQAGVAVSSQPPDSLYPPVVASHTAQSKAARRRRLEHFYQKVHGAPSIEEKLRLYGRLQRPKYTVYPQTMAINADRWYRSFTKTVFVPGLPRGAALRTAKAPEPAGAREGAAQEAPEDSRAPEARTAAPGAEGAAEPAVGAKPYLSLGELRSLVCDALLHESFYQSKKRPFLYREQEHTPGPFLTQLVSALSAYLSSYNPLLASSSLGEKRGRGAEGSEGSRALWSDWELCRRVSGVAELQRPSLGVHFVFIIRRGASGV